ncbi:MAG TPA: hypothetical protein DCY53_07570 [Desulfobacteraceae bacterium]|nr:hypothetical protein [Desulfobacteraceae bacterium]
MNNSIKILLIEDNPGDIRLIRELLSESQRSSVDITVSERLSDGRSALVNQEFDVVLLDLTLPDSQGIETLRKVYPDAPHAAVVVLTGLDDEETALTSLREGAQDYLVKDRMDPDALWRTIRYSLERKQAEQALVQSERKLKAKTADLEDANAALRALLKRMDADKAELEEKLIHNIKELVDPFIEKLKKSRLTEQQKGYVQIITSNLEEIVSPFVRHLSANYIKLTPTEIQVANFVKQGKTTKDIAAQLNLSARTIEVNRNNIRKKLGITNQKINLRTYLLSLR